MIQVTAESSCFLTESHNSIVVSNRDRRGKPLRTVICHESGLVYTDPRPSSDEIIQFYERDYRQQYKRVSVPRPKHVLRGGIYAKRRIDTLANLIPPKAKILDIGSGGGEFVFLAKQAGYQSQGIEPDPNFVQFSIDRYEIPVKCGFYQDADYGDSAFDLITLFHVLEHFEQPLDALKKMAGWLRVGGRLMVEVPDVEYCGIAPQHRWHWGHLYSFSVQTLAATGLKAGLDLVYSKSGPGKGNITAVFQKPENLGQSPDEQASALLKGSFDRTYNILKRHSFVRHYANVQLPLIRMTQKAVQYTQEFIRLTTKPPQSYRQLLLDL